MKRILCLLRDLIFSILITAVILYGIYWLAFHGEYPGDAQRDISFMLAPLLFIVTMTSIGLAVRFLIDRYFNRFITVLCFIFLTGIHWCEIVTEKISSWGQYFESGFAPYAVMALASFLAIAIGKIIIRFKS